MENSRTCEICNVDVHRASFAKHLRSKKHLELENGTRRAQIPRKPLDPPISWIVTQSLIFQIADPFCLCVHTDL